MPLYNYICRDHGEFDSFAPLKDYNLPTHCHCGALSPRGLSVPHFHVDNVDYTCPITGEWVGSKREHENNLAKHNCRVLEPGEKEANLSQRAKAEADFDKAIETTVEREVELLPSDKKESLHTELTRQNLDLAVNRTTPV